VIEYYPNKRGTRRLWLLLCLVSCLPVTAQTPGNSDVAQSARQLAIEADDNASTLSARQEALQKLEDAARIFLSVDDKVEAARVLTRAGRLQQALNDPHKAIESHQRALDLVPSGSTPEVRVDALNGLAAAYLVLQKKPEAEERLRQALELIEQSAYVPGKAEALLTLSDVQNYDNHAIALTTAQSALAAWESLGDQRGLARTHSQIARCYLAQNMLFESAQQYQLALQLWQAANNQLEMASVLINLSIIEFRKGDWQNSISFLSQAQRFVEDKDEPEKAGQIAAGLADAFNESGLPENGVSHYQRALEYYRLTKDPHLINYAVWGLGTTYYLLGDYPAALNQFNQALLDVDKNSLEAAQSYECIGMVYLKTGEYDDASRYLQSALAIYEKAVNPMEAARVQGLMGHVYYEQGQLERGRKIYLQSLATFRRISDRVNEAAVCYELGRLELKSGNYDAAEEFLRRSIEATEDVRRAPTSSDLTAAFSATVHQRYQGYIECLMRKHQAQPQQGLDVQAFETNELSQARSLRELLRMTQTNLIAGLDPQLAEREQALRQSLRVKEDSKVALLARTYKKEDLDELESELARLDGEYKQINDTIRTRYPSYERITRPTTLSLQQIQEQVVADAQTVLLEYSLGSEHSYVWAVTRNDIQSYELPPLTRINEAGQKVYQLLTAAGDGKTDNELKRATQELSEMILSPVAAKLNKRRVIVVSDGVLNYIPFQIMPASSASDEPLVATTEVINAPSASILEQLGEERTRRQAPTNVLAAFGDPVFASNYAQHRGTNPNEYVASARPLESEGAQPALRDIEPAGDTFDPVSIQPLFYSKIELSNLRDLAGPDSFVATGFDASREKLAAADLNRYAILHFATHGILDPKRPERSGLFLSMVDRDGHAQNGFVGLQDIYSLHAPVDLVVLSACRTGLGKDVRGEGLIGLTRGFMYAGAASVVASLWKVDDEATAELMKHFYANMLQGGMTPAAALRAAQNSIREQPQWRAPYYWAAFTLQGDYRQVIKVTPRETSLLPSLIYSIVALGGLMAVALWWHFHRKAKRTTQA